MKVPWKPILIAIALGLAAVTLYGIISDPFGIRSYFQHRLERRADSAEADASARTLEVGGERDQAQRVETYHTQVIEVRDVTARAETEARSAPDANQPLPADRAARIERNTDGLCDARPVVCGPAPADPADRSDDDL